MLRLSPGPQLFTTIENDENALLDISDFVLPSSSMLSLDEDSDEQLSESQSQSQASFNYDYRKSMGRLGKRTQMSNGRRGSTSTTSPGSDVDEDSGFCSNLTPPAPKIARFDDEVFFLKSLINEVNQQSTSEQHHVASSALDTSTKLNGAYPSKSRNGKYELKILQQPEEQHRARYLTEGSRGAIKDKSGTGHPVIKLTGFNKGPVKLQCFIGHDKHIGTPHLFYQASKITGKNSTRCYTNKVDGTTVVVIELTPDHDMQATIDCIGILKERNVDVEQKLLRLKNRVGTGDSQEALSIPSKKRSTRCRLVCRCQIPGTNEFIQVVSTPILCTQPLGVPEICRKSLSQCDMKGGQELFIIGKNFLKDAKVIWKSANWSKIVEPDKEFLHSTHLVCLVPPYDGPKMEVQNAVEVSLCVRSGGKYSDHHKFTYLNTDRGIQNDIFDINFPTLSCASNNFIHTS